MKPFFQPWVGKAYRAEALSGIRVLILGESHYGSPEQQRCQFTQDWVASYANGSRNNRFFTTVTKLFLGTPSGVTLTAMQRGDFWSKIAFYNYIQSFPGSTARVRPTSALWCAAERPLLHVLAELAPQVVFVLGRQLSSHAAHLVPESINVCAIPHPASFGFNRAQWSAVVNAQLRTTPG
jgi:hypothetical protein